MKTGTIFLLFLVIPPSLSAQKQNPLDIFRPLQGYVWCAEGKWGDASKFRQEIEIEFSLEDNIVIVESKGFTDREQKQFGQRNHGIRYYDEENDQILFWEFDVFGSLSEGTVRGEGKNLVYTYTYGETQVNEVWEYKNDSTYGFTVGVYENNKWTQTFLETKFVRK